MMEAHHEQRRRIITAIVALGFGLSMFFHYFQSALAGRWYPYNTFLFDPKYRFSDLLVLWDYTAERNPYYSLSAVYPPFAYVPLYALTTVKVYETAVAILALVLLTSLVLLAFDFLNKTGLWERLETTLVLTVMSYPVLFLLDRANVEILTFAGITMFVVLLRSGHVWASTIPLACAIAIKPLLAPFLLPLVHKQRGLPLALTLGLTVLLTVGAALFLEGGIPRSIAGLSRALADFHQTYELGPHGLQHNVSLFGLLHLMLGALSPTSLGHGSIFLAQLSTLWMYVNILLLATIAWIVLRYPLNEWRSYALIVAATLLLPRVSFDYRLIYVLIPTLAFIIGRERDPRENLIAVIFALLLVPKDYGWLLGDVSIAVILNPLLLIGLAVLALPPPLLHLKRLAAT